jgi:hypothetical protein
MKRWISSNLIYIIGAAVGAAAGFIYWQQAGCTSGTCAITSKPVNSSVYGAVMGTLVFGLFKNKKPVK